MLNKNRLFHAVLVISVLAGVRFSENKDLAAICGLLIYVLVLFIEYKIDKNKS